MAKTKCTRTQISRDRPIAMAGISQVFDGLYSTDYKGCSPEGLTEFEGRLRHPDGERVWATVKGNRVKLFWHTRSRKGIAEEVVTVNPTTARKRFG